MTSNHSIVEIKSYIGLHKSYIRVHVQNIKLKYNLKIVDL